MKQYVVAKRAGFTPQEFSNIMNGRRKLLRIEHLYPIACAMGVDVNALYEVEKKGVIEKSKHGLEKQSKVISERGESLKHTLAKKHRLAEQNLILR